MRRLAAAALLAATIWLPTVSSPPVVQAAACTGWSSTTTPPPAIRVLRSTGVVQTVDFKTYVKVVMPAEWNALWPMESLRAGAVAIKQYAWYYTMHYRGGTGTGGCYDVRDSSIDQVYSPETRTPAAAHIQAVESTWPESILKNGSFVFTSYRPGSTPDVCGAGYDGYHLIQHGARGCALDGKTGEQILEIYYGPGLVIQGAPTPPGPPTAVSAAGRDTSALVGWSAPASDGNSTITAYTATSTPGGKTCTSSGGLSCYVGGLTNGQAYTFTVTATNSVGTGPASAPSASTTPQVVIGGTYHALAPKRILDTRDGTGGLSGPFSSHVARTFQVTGRGGVPAGATAVTGNLTVTQQTSQGFLFAGPIAMNNPTSSTLNFPANDDRANAVTVALSGTGTLSVAYAAPTFGPTAQVIFDVTGYFTSDTTGATYHAISPTRILDTRDGTGGLSGKFSSHVARTFQVTGGVVPSNATAVTGNLTVTQQSSLGYLYIGPVAMNNPTSSTLNFPINDDRANGVTAALGGSGQLSITYAAPVLGPTAHVVFDVTGYFTPDASGAKYVPLTPGRILDSRDGTGGLSGPFSSHVARTFGVIGHGGVPSRATAVTGNLTVTQQNNLGFLFIGPVAMNNPTTSTLNFPLNDDRADGVTVALGTGGTLSVTYAAPVTGKTAHVIFDVTGYFVPAGTSK
jgi:Stage II sporulation protein/Fibronectin type III domain